MSPAPMVNRATIEARLLEAQGIELPSMIVPLSVVEILSVENVVTCLLTI